MEVLLLPVDALVPDPGQPRRRPVDSDQLARLADSIRARGVIQPIRVAVYGDGYRIVIGECRWRASKLAGLAEVPCLLVEGDPSEVDILADQIVENSLRADISPIDHARAIERLKRLKGCSAKAMAEEYGFSPASMTRAASLLSLSGEIQQLVEEGRVPESTAYILSRLASEAEMLELAHAVAAGKLTRDQVAALVGERRGRKGSTPPASRVSCKHGGMSFSVRSGQPLTCESLLAALQSFSKEVKRLADSGKDLSALAALAAS